MFIQEHFLIIALMTINKRGARKVWDAPQNIQRLIVSLDYLGKAHHAHRSLNAGLTAIQNISDQSSHIGHIKDSIAIHIAT